MKILHYIYAITDSVPSQAALNVALSTSRNMDIALVVSILPSEEYINQWRNERGINIQCIYNGSLSRIYPIHKSIVQLLDKEHPDLVHLHGIANWQSALVGYVAHRKGIATCVSAYGMLAPEILNVDFVRHRLIPLVIYQFPMIRQSTSFIAFGKKEYSDVENLNVKRRIDLIPAPGRLTDWCADDENIICNQLAKVYRKTIDTIYYTQLTKEEKSFMEALVAAAVAKEADITIPTINIHDNETLRRLTFYAWDEDVAEIFANNIMKVCGTVQPVLIDVSKAPRYKTNNAKRRGSLEELHSNQIKGEKYLNETQTVERTLLSNIAVASQIGMHRLTLRHKSELYRMFRYSDFNEFSIALALRKSNLKRFTVGLQNMLHRVYNMPKGYDIFE